MNNPINPIIYISFQGELFPDAEKALRQRFELSPLSELGFKLQFSPCCLKTAQIDLKTIGSNCRLATLFVALLKEPKPSAVDCVEAQRVELASACSEIGVETLVCVPQNAQPAAELKRVMNQYGCEPLSLPADSDAREIVQLLESRLLPAPEQLLPSENRLPMFAEPLQHMLTEPASSPTLRLLLAQNESVDPVTGQCADLQSNQGWALQNLVANNLAGAETNLRRCLKLFDADFMANYWLCRILQQNAKKDSEFQELLLRAEMLLRLNQLQPVPDTELVVELKQMQADAHSGLRQPAQALGLLEEAVQMQPSAAMWEALVLASLQHLAQSELPLQRQDPTLIKCKRALLQLSSYGIEILQGALARLQRKVAKDKLELILLGVRHDLVAQLKAVKQHEHSLLATATDWELIVPGQKAALEQSTVLGKSLWSQVKIAQESARQQLTLLQMLAARMLTEQQQAEQLAQKQARLQAQSSELEKWRTQAEEDFISLTARQNRQRMFFVVMLVVALISISGFWWLPVNNTLNAAIFGGCVIISALFAHGWQTASTLLKQLHNDCIEQDKQHQLEEDELPEPRTFNGWFDRLTVRREKLDSAANKVAAGLKRSRLQLQARSGEFLMLVGRFEDLLLNQYPGLLHAWHRDQHIGVSNVAAEAMPLPEILLEYGAESFKSKPLGLVGLSDASSRNAPYFTQPIDAERVRRLHPIQRKVANTIERAFAKLG